MGLDGLLTPHGGRDYVYINSTGELNSQHAHAYVHTYTDLDMYMRANTLIALLAGYS